MLNDRSSTLALLRTRRSGKPRDMVPPGPSHEQLYEILEIAARTPDHGKLFPWRFVIVSKAQRPALAQLLRSALAQEEPDALPAKYEKAEEFAHQGEALIVVLASPTEGHKIPVWEQQLSVGAAGMNLLHAVHALGFVGGWITGWEAISPHVTAAFCEPGQSIAGFMFIGSPTGPLEERPRPNLDDVVKDWVPPGD